MDNQARLRKRIIDKNKKAEFFRYIREVPTEDGKNLIMTHKVPAHQPAKASVMLVHGLGQNRYSWTLSKRSFENYLVDLGFETYNIEFRGHGLSRANGSGYSNYLSTHLNYDLPAFIKSIYKINKGKKIFYIGHSLGGSIGYAMGAKYQEYLAGMIAIGSPFNMAKGNMLLSSIAKCGVALNRLMTFKPPVQPDVFFVDFLGVIAKQLLFIIDHKNYRVPLQVWLPQSMERDVLVERIEKGFDRTSFNVIRFFFEWGARKRFTNGRGTIDYEERIKDLKIPILFIVGDCDYAVPLPSIQEAYQKAGSKDKILNVFGDPDRNIHWGHLDLISGKYAPEIIWPYIYNWLTQRLSHAAEE